MNAAISRSLNPNRLTTPLVGWCTQRKLLFLICCPILKIGNRLGVPYHSWRITHAKHHASTGHMTQDQVFVPSTRSQRGLPPFNPEKETLNGSRVSEEVKKELWEALGDSPIGAMIECAKYLVSLLVRRRCQSLLMTFSLEDGQHMSWSMLLVNSDILLGQTVSQCLLCSMTFIHVSLDFNSNSPMFMPHHQGQVTISLVGVLLWLTGISTWIYYKGFWEVFRLYLVPYLWLVKLIVNYVPC